jgi:hypothetical protein
LWFFYADFQKSVSTVSALATRAIGAGTIRRMDVPPKPALARQALAASPVQPLAPLLSPPRIPQSLEFFDERARVELLEKAVRRQVLQIEVGAHILVAGALTPTGWEPWLAKHNSRRFAITLACRETCGAPRVLVSCASVMCPSADAVVAELLRKLDEHAEAHPGCVQALQVDRAERAGPSAHAGPPAPAPAAESVRAAMPLTVNHRTSARRVCLCALAHWQFFLRQYPKAYFLPRPPRRCPFRVPCRRTADKPAFSASFRKRSRIHDGH